MLKVELDTHAAFTYGTLLKSCGIKTSTRRRAPTDGIRQCRFSIFAVILNFLMFFVYSLLGNLYFHFLIAKLSGAIYFVFYKIFTFTALYSGVFILNVLFFSSLFFG